MILTFFIDTLYYKITLHMTTFDKFIESNVKYLVQYNKYLKHYSQAKYDENIVDICKYFSYMHSKSLYKCMENINDKINTPLFCNSIFKSYMNFNYHYHNNLNSQKITRKIELDETIKFCDNCNDNINEILLQHFNDNFKNILNSLDEKTQNIITKELTIFDDLCY